MRTIEEIKAEYKKVKSMTPKGYTNTDLCELEYELRNALIFNIPLDRLEEICNAERDGRLVILPCKVGDMGYRIKSDGTIDTPYVKQFHISQKPWQTIVSFEGSVCGITDFGKTVFLTQAEAEQALKGGAE